MSKINVDGKDITIEKANDTDFISLTDMAKSQNENIVISKWLSLKHTITYLGEWEALNNPDFNYTEFGVIRNLAGDNNFALSAKDWIERTNAIGITAKTGRYGGTYAHVDIAFQFGMWISPRFQLLLVKEFQRLKKEESDRLESGWDYRRFLSKTNYTIHTDAIKQHIIPELTEAQAKYAYATEADMLNVALFGLTAKQWKEANPKEALQGLNMRDMADVHQLIVLSNLENTNAFLIERNIPQSHRLLELRKSAVSQLTSLRKSSYTIDKIQSPFKQVSSTARAVSEAKHKPTSGDNDLDQALGDALSKKFKK